MTLENVISIKGGSYENVKRALKQWVDLYSESLESDMQFELYKDGRGSQFIKADQRLDNERFNYLVNYLKYPEDITYQVTVEGFTTIKDQKIFDKGLLEKKVMIYVAGNDSEGDNVLAVTEENQAYKIHFGGKVIKLNESKGYVAPTILPLNKPEVVRPKRKVIVKKTAEEVVVTGKRFKLFSIIIAVLIVLSLFALLDSKPLFFKITLILGICIAVWFLGDYRMLQVDRYYAYSMTIALLFLAYGVLLTTEFSWRRLTLLDLGSLYPITILVVQRPLRYVFKTLFKREPVVDKPPPTFLDFVYSFILFMALMILPFLIFELGH